VLGYSSSGEPTNSPQDSDAGISGAPVPMECIANVTSASGTTLALTIEAAARGWSPNWQCSPGQIIGNTTLRGCIPTETVHLRRLSYWRFLHCSSIRPNEILLGAEWPRANL